MRYGRSAISHVAKNNFCSRNRLEISVMHALLWMLSTLSLGLSATVPVSTVTFDATTLSVNRDKSVDQFRHVPSNKNSSQNKNRQIKNLYDLTEFDHYFATMIKKCTSGDSIECFKFQMIGLVIKHFDQPEYFLHEIVRQPYHYSAPVRSNEFLWSQSKKFAVKKASIKTTTVNANLPPRGLREIEVHAPRFLDEIADEIDTLENKKDSLFSRHRLRELLIPMLIVLKIFKLKLLLFLPLILGFASLKKFLGSMAIVIPILIAFFKLCKPIMSNYQPPVYTKNGLGTYSHYPIDQNNYQDANSYRNDYYPDGVSYGKNLVYQGQKKY